MKCPHCGKQLPMPTARQIEAYRLVHIHQDTQEQAAAMMGIKQKNVSKLLYRLKKIRPDLFEDKRWHIRGKKPFQFRDNQDSQPLIAF